MHQPAMLHYHDGAHEHERATDDERADAADVIYPFAYAEPANIGEHRDPKERNGQQEKERAAVVNFRGGVSAHNVSHHAGHGKEQRRHEKHVGHPIAPAADETVEIAEAFFGPKVEAAFAGQMLRQFDDADSLRDKKEQDRGGHQPDHPDATGGDDRHNV